MKKLPKFFSFLFVFFIFGLLFFILETKPALAQGCIPTGSLRTEYSADPCGRLGMRSNPCCSPDAICQATKVGESRTMGIQWKIECLSPSGELPLGETKEEKPVLPKLQVEIPGFEGFTEEIEPEEGRFVIPWLGEYWIALYKWAVRAISVLAVVMIIIAGVQWMLAAGNVGQISQAKDRITGALIGLVLILGTNLIFSFINPELIFFRPIVIEKIKRVELNVFEGEFTDVTVPPGWNRESNGVLHLLQCDSSWASQPYIGSCPGGTSRRLNSICASGCGITSLAMITQKYFTSKPAGAMDPPDIAVWLVENGYRAPKEGGRSGATCTGVSHIGIKDAAWGLSRLRAQEFSSKDKADQLLKEGKPLIAHLRNPAGCMKEPKTCKFTGCGHYIILTDVDENGIYSVNDPGNAGEHRFHATPKELFKDCSNLGFIYLYP